MIAQSYRNEKPPSRVPEARYAYYRRCQMFRRNGEQCKAPAEKCTSICHAHARQHATALRRKRELMMVLATAVEKMRARGRPEFEIADIFADFDAIQATIAAMAQALIDGRIDCKTAGQLAMTLQTASKLLWMVHRKGRERRNGRRIQPQIRIEEPQVQCEVEFTANERKWVCRSRKGQVADTAKAAVLVAKIGFASPRVRAEQATGPPQWLRAA